jgi:nitrogen regulatory protein P-II 1
MKEIKAYIRTTMIDAVMDALESEPDRPGMTVTEVRGFGHPKQGEPPVLQTLAKLEIVVMDNQVQSVVDLILKHARTGRYGDGKIFVSNVEKAYRIRTGDQGTDALRVPGEQV